MESIKLQNLPEMTVSDVVEKLGHSYIELIKKDIPFKHFPSVMLWGPPGVGKSESIREIAELIKKETGKKTKVTDVRLILFNPIDLRGIPTASVDKSFAIWLKPKIFDMDESKDVVNILFLDEISSCPPSVQAAAYQITLDRIIGEHKLPENCIVVCAGNRITDKSVANKMPKALSNRLLHIEIDPDFDSWFEWAKKNNINKDVLDFLSIDQQYLINFDANLEDLAFATPRSWEMVSNLLNDIGMNKVDLIPLIEGLVGKDIALDFNNWYKVKAGLPNISDIFSGKNVEPIDDQDTIFVLRNLLVSAAKVYKDDKEKMTNCLNYIFRLKRDFQLLIMKSILDIERDYKAKLILIPEFVDWYKREGVALSENFG